MQILYVGLILYTMHVDRMCSKSYNYYSELHVSIIEVNRMNAHDSFFAHFMLNNILISCCIKGQITFLFTL